MVYIIKVTMGKKIRTSPARRKKTPPATVSQVFPGVVEAKLFMNGRSQALRLPKEFRFPGKSVFLKRTPGGVVIIPDDPWKGLMLAYGSIPDFPDRDQGPDQERPELDRLFN
jgi:antitoxin VapB